MNLNNINDHMIEVLFEDNHIIVVNKKAGDITQGDKTGDTPLPDKVKDWLKKKYNKPGNVFLGVVHRLDRPTSGIVIFAKTSKALTRLNEMFRSKNVSKTYWAVVENKPSILIGKCEDLLVKNEKQNKSYVTKDVQNKNAKNAILNYKLLSSSINYHLLEVNLETGRHHQIRVQLANIGCIIKGDVKYGARRSNKDKSISLHARKIDFSHPISKTLISITAPLPKTEDWRFFDNTLSE
ncbi:MAG: RNA pseudouridine synthase [Crocinitomicaceae bacterium]|nr:RNA pseudouridine synthase [Crocinitomicaceae bacterium]